MRAEPRALRLPAAVAGALRTQSEACYPDEACGILLGRDDRAECFLPLENLAERYHQGDPAAFPRGGRDSFCFDLARAQGLAREAGLPWLATVHSHADCEAGLSAEDRSGLAPGRLPLPPWQLVVACHAGRVAGMRCFRWDGAGFAEAPLLIENDPT